MAMPRLPGESGSSASTLAPEVVSRDGLACTVAPQVSMSVRRYGFWSYEARTIQTSQSRPNCAHEKASALPHCPAPVSVVIRRVPSAAL